GRRDRCVRIDVLAEPAQRVGLCIEHFGQRLEHDVGIAYRVGPAVPRHERDARDDGIGLRGVDAAERERVLDLFRTDD
ncbi:hypothetical protein M3583_23755, partial [Bacillus subtilis]|nr:hypothetical protein [Bacillus subtilis]